MQSDNYQIIIITTIMKTDFYIKYSSTFTFRGYFAEEIEIY